MSSTGAARPILRAYVDETGDRGFSAKSSPYFAFACVLVADEHDAALRAAVRGLRIDLNTPPGKALHWNQHVKSFSRRQHVAATLGALPDVSVIYVLVEKAALPPASGSLADHVIFYNYAAVLVLERVLLTAKNWPGGARDAVVRFGHVKGFDHSKTMAYFTLRIQRKEPAWMPWHLLSGGTVHFDGQGNWDGLQAADQYAGMLHTALRADEFGNYEPQHFLAIFHQLRRVDGKAWNRGFKFWGNIATLKALPWWSQVTS